MSHDSLYIHIRRAGGGPVVSKVAEKYKITVKHSGGKGASTPTPTPPPPSVLSTHFYSRLHSFTLPDIMHGNF